MPIVTLALAASLAAAEWKRQPVGPGDYPTDALRSNRSAAGLLDVVIDPKGKVVSCVVSTAVGDEKLASQLCGLVKSKRAIPAHDASGSPIYGFKHELLRLYIPGTKVGDEIANVRQGPDADLTVANMPAGAGSSIEVALTIAVDQAGKVTACDYDTGSGHVDFAQAACSSVGQQEFDKLDDRDGKPVGYVRALKVRFSAGDGRTG